MRTSINLLPWREQLREERRRQFLTLLGGSVAVAALLMILIHMAIASRLSLQQQRSQYLRQEIAQLDQAITTIKDLQQQRTALIERMEIIQELQQNRAQIGRLFDTLVNILPKGVYLEILNRLGPNLEIQGKAESHTNVSVFMRNIEATGWLFQTFLTEIKTDEGVQHSTFKLKLLMNDPLALRLVTGKSAQAKAKANQK